MTANQIHIDFGQILERARLAVRRASAFMALGMTATSTLPTTALKLENFGISFLPDQVPDNLAAELKAEFRTWVVGNALRELDALYGLFVDQLYGCCLMVACAGAPLPPDFDRRVKRVQDDTNVAGKLDRLKDDFGIAARHRDHIQSVSHARNSLTHNAGRVGPRQCVNGTSFTMTWQGFVFEFVAVSTGKVEQVWDGDLRLPYAAVDPQGVTIQMRIVDRTRTYQLGEPIVLSPHDLNEICWVYQITAEELVQGATAYGQARGIPVANP